MSQSVFSIKTVSGNTLIVAPLCIEAMMIADWGTSLYLTSGARWDTSESYDDLIGRLVTIAKGHIS